MAFPFVRARHRRGRPAARHGRGARPEGGGAKHPRLAADLGAGPRFRTAPRSVGGGSSCGLSHSLYGFMYSMQDFVHPQ